MRSLIAQLDCPVATEVEAFLAAAKKLKSAGALHLYNAGGGLHPLALGSLLEEELSKEIYVHFHPGDRNRAALFSDLLTANVLGLEKIVLSSGQHPTKTRFKEAKPVYDLDLLQFLRMALRAKAGFDPADGLLEEGLSLQIGVLAKVDSPLELLRLKQMADMGADYIFLKWPSKLLPLSQLQREIGKPIYLSLDLERVKKEEKEWREVRRSGIAGINLLVPAGQEAKGEEALKWFSRYL
jgi:5,10-methylenetetrahydrofolate reductase